MSPGPRDAPMLKHMLTVATSNTTGRQGGGGGGGAGPRRGEHHPPHATDTLEGRRSLPGGGAPSNGGPLPGVHHHPHHLHNHTPHPGPPHHHHHPHHLQQQQQQQQQQAAQQQQQQQQPNHHGASPVTQLSVKVNGAAGGRHHPALNMSSLSSSKHSVGGNSGSVSPGTTTVTRTTGLDHSRDQSHLTDLSHLSHLSHLSPIPPADASKMTAATKRSTTGSLLPRFISLSRGSGARAALTSLGLLCLTSLLLALLALTFLVELTPLEGNADGVHEVTLALAALTLSLDLSCLLICSAQFIFAVKLAKSPNGEERMSKYLRQSSVSRVCAIGGFFVSVPVFLTGVILYTFVHFQSTPAILTSVFIGVGIIFCGCAMIHNVFVWQKEKTKAVAAQNIQQAVNHEARLREVNSSPLPNATLDLSGTTPPHELSTLV